MDKFAMVKEAEVRGVLAAFHDNGYVDFGDRETFDKIASAVSEVLPQEYSIEDIAGATDYVMNGGMEKEAMEKSAEEEIADNAQMMLGELALMKVAGEIDDAQFEEGVEAIVKEAASKCKGTIVPSGNKHTIGTEIKSILKGEQAREGAKYTKEMAGKYMKARKSGKAMNKVKELLGGGKKFYGEGVKSGLKHALKGAGKTGLAYGAIAGGVGGAGYGAKKLYDYISK